MSLAASFPLTLSLLTRSGLCPFFSLSQSFGPNKKAGRCVAILTTVCLKKPGRLKRRCQRASTIYSIGILEVFGTLERRHGHG